MYRLLTQRAAETLAEQPTEPRAVAATANGEGVVGGAAAPDRPWLRKQTSRTMELRLTSRRLKAQALVWCKKAAAQSHPEGEKHGDLGSSVLDSVRP